MIEKINLTGEKFGRLSVLREATKGEAEGRRSRQWICRCDCGKTTMTTTHALTSGHTKSCGCLSAEKTRVKPGERYGELTVIRECTADEIPHRAQGERCWKCICSCGRDATISTADLTTGHVKSCGCLKNKHVSLVGKRFGMLTAVEEIPYNNVPHKSKQQHEYFFRCKCDCGKEITARGSSLRSGHTASCGCQADKWWNKPKHKDLTGQVFGKLQVLGLAEIRKTQVNGNLICRAIWECQCACGSRVNIMAQSLCASGVKSCGCDKSSYGEQRIQEILIANNIDYIYNKAFFADLIGEKGTKLRYDFILLENGEPFRIIEYDGRQHYKYTAFFGTPLEKTQRYDEIKNQYAFAHNIPMVRIPYTEKKAISIELITGDKYLIGGKI